MINELADAMEPATSSSTVVTPSTPTPSGEKAIRERGLHFVGARHLRRREGALNGPSIMPGGPAESYRSLGPLLEISAHVDGVPCCTHIGPDGAGHFVKMVHNGIEYSDMQLIGEAYQLLRDGLGLTAPQIAEVFTEWNSGDLDSFLVEITAEVLQPDRRKKTGKPLVDVILDEAEQKGTGRWTVKSPWTSGAGDRHRRGGVRPRAVRVGGAAQGHHRAGLRQAGSTPNGRKAIHRGCPPGAVRVEDHRLRAGLQPDPGRLGRIRLGHHTRRPGHHLARWLHHRAKFLNRIRRPSTRTRTCHPDRRAVLPQRHRGRGRRLAAVVVTATELGIPIPGFASALSYYDALRTERLPAALTQGLRDLFGRTPTAASTPTRPRGSTPCGRRPQRDRGLGAPVRFLDGHRPPTT